MKLEIFDFIDKTISILEAISDELEKASTDIEDFFRDNLSKEDNLININSRVKTPLSLKEKILRNNYYIKYNCPKKLLSNLSDLIGVRIECRFIEDEMKVYKELLKLFNREGEEGYYYTCNNKNLMLKLKEKQPQKQKNGFEIYRIDGRYIYNERVINFELQIKALVNMFWGEIEHKILYKNFNYMMTENFLRDIMASIKENLAMMDKQLMILYNHLNDTDTSSNEVRKTQIEALLSKIIHEIYSAKIRKDIGFIVDFRKSCDVIMSYIFQKDRATKASEYSNIFLKILERFNEIASNEINFNKYIEFERELRFKDDFSKSIGESIIKVINKDFRWNLLFKILFEIERGNNSEDFEGFINYIESRFYENLHHNYYLNTFFNGEEKEEISKSILYIVAEVFREDTNIDFVNQDNIEAINKKITHSISAIKDYNYWKTNKEDYLEKIRLQIKSIF